MYFDRKEKENGEIENEDDESEDELNHPLKPFDIARLKQRKEKKKKKYSFHNYVISKKTFDDVYKLINSTGK